MPQMSPLSWLILFLFFMLTFILFNMMNYYIIQYQIKSIQLHKKSFKYNWKW